MEIISHEERPFPPVEDLEGRLNSVFNIVNTELKSATLLVLDDSPAEASEIRARVREVAGTGYLPRPSVFGDYCHHTLFPISVVAEETVRREGVEDICLAYSLTEAGKRYGRPVVSLALQYAVENNLSLYQVLGPTGTRGKIRSPLARIKILKQLNKKGELRRIDLDNETGLNSTQVATNELGRIGFIDYSSTGESQKGKGIIVYRWIAGTNHDEVKPVNWQKDLTERAAELLRDRKAITIPEANELLNQRNPNIISHIYSGLVKQGFAIREEGFTGRKFQSRATLREEARSFLEFENQVEKILIHQLSEQDAQDIYLEFIAKPSYREVLRRAIEIYRRVSPHLTQKPFEILKEEILELLRKSPGMRPSEMKRTHKNIQPNLTGLVKSGTIRVEKQGREARYYVNE
ncbi:hypothetical protein HYV88_02845 [Candidatus Woesearchaeota archaeon]|nr:hypothetical protein [Candidatus Woesearchaeota archaeon]